jgi:hypothetical protein
VRVVPGIVVPHTPAPAVTLEEVWPGLDAQEKPVPVAGIVTVVASDGVTTVAEIALLRTVCALLHCPLPPLAHTSPEQVHSD